MDLKNRKLRFAAAGLALAAASAAGCTLPGGAGPVACSDAAIQLQQAAADAAYQAADFKQSIADDENLPEGIRAAAQFAADELTAKGDAILEQIASCEETTEPTVTVLVE